MKKLQTVLILSSGMLLCNMLQAIEPIHNSIYNTPSSSNSIYNGNNTFVEDTPFPEKLNGNEDDLDVEYDHNDESQALENYRHNSILEIAVMNNDVSQVQELLNNQKIDINYQNKDGRTALHFAAAQDNNRIAQLLLEHGANITTADWQGWTPLHVAVDANAFAVVKTLIDHKANLFTENVEGKTPQDYAKNDIMKEILAGKSV